MSVRGGKGSVHPTTLFFRLAASASEVTGAATGQYFEGARPEVWTFHIGGYQVCEKWLKDRRGACCGRGFGYFASRCGR
jgi:hypothetical protein